MTIEVIPASEYTIQELADLYNQTRVDYLVPMPMNADRLAEYIQNFDIDLAHSGVARDSNGKVLGLGMLGVRADKTWITRLGVLPVDRRGGAGGALMDYLLENANAIGLETTHLEVIKNNEPAYKLFLKKGFCKADTYLVMRRAPRTISVQPAGQVQWLDREEALQALQTYPQHLTWITAIESMNNATNLQGMQAHFPNGNTGWLVYRQQKFFLSHLVMHTEKGNPIEVGKQLLLHLYSRYPRIDTYAENIHECDPHLPAFQSHAFFENFARIEMRRQAYI
jgi:ribosomal protein S18 acetylase RimI-like enzyme